jgi:Zn-dependent protease with chaperone function
VSFDAASRNIAGLLALPLSLSAYVACGLVSYALLPLADTGASPVPGANVLALCAPFVLLCSLVVVAVARSLAGQRRSAREIARLTASRGLAPEPRLAATAARAGLEGRVTVVDDDEAFSFVYGVRRPRVVVSRGMLGALSQPELAAVLEHERYHVAQLDPLRAALAQALCAGFFFLPVLAALAARYMTARELAADERAAASHGAGALAGALLKSASAQARGPTSGTVPLAAPATLEARVLRLEGANEPRLSRPSLSELGLSLVGVGVFLGAFLLALCGLAGAAAVGHALAPLSVGGLLEAVLWLAPAICVPLGVYWWLARRALAGHFASR